MPLSPDLIIREAVSTDIPEIIRQRRRMYEDMNCNDAHSLTTMASLTADYLANAIPNGTFHARLAPHGDRTVAEARLS